MADPRLPKYPNLLSQGQQPRCCHGRQSGGDGIFCKSTFKIANDYALSYPKPPDPWSRCILCDVVHPARQLFYVDRGLRTHRESAGVGHYVESVPSDGVLPDRGEKGYPPRVVDEVDESLTHFTIDLKAGQIGEAYHALVSCIMYRCLEKPPPLIRLEEKEGIEEIQDLFTWYNIKSIRSGTAGSGGKKTGSSKVALLHRSMNAHNVYHHQDRLFEDIRHKLDTVFQDFPAIRYWPPEDGAPYFVRKYFWPSYAAKYWVNRYLRITARNQILEPSDPQTRLDGRPRLKTLPKSHEVCRMAVIHIRRHASSLIKRVMDDRNLEHVVKSIAWANQAARAAGDKAEVFSHVMLYGDFCSNSGPRLIDLALKHIKDVQVFFVSALWRTDERGEIGELLAKFRDVDFDCLPKQVKILGIWTMICQRYHRRICVIGHRSGFLESAGLIGMPIFYLNNERHKGDISFDGDIQPGDLLWQPVKKPQHDRLRELADVLNTFIPVEALGPSDKVNVRNTTMAESSSDVREIEIFHVDRKYEHELMAALFMFMCCKLDVENWASGKAARLDVVRMARESLENEPAWIARVGMMHDQQGRDWLRQRYCFAVNTVSRQGNALEVTDGSAVLERAKAAWETQGKQVLEIALQETSKSQTYLAVSLKIIDPRLDQGGMLFYRKTGLTAPDDLPQTMDISDENGRLPLSKFHLGGREDDDGFAYDKFCVGRDTVGTVSFELEMRPEKVKLKYRDAVSGLPMTLIWSALTDTASAGGSGDGLEIPGWKFLPLPRLNSATMRKEYAFSVKWKLGGDRAGRHASCVRDSEQLRNSGVEYAASLSGCGPADALASAVFSFGFGKCPHCGFQGLHGIRFSQSEVRLLPGAEG